MTRRQGLPSRAARVAYEVTDRQNDGAACGGAQMTVRQIRDALQEELPTDETEYEVRALVVYERSGPWYRIAMQRASGWIRHEGVDDFKPYPEWLKDKLSYVRARWDGMLWRTPGTGPGARIPKGWTPYLSDNVPAEVLAVRRVRNVSWIQIRLRTEDICAEPLEGVTSTSGWMPAYRETGETSVWFYSRGC
jgi:hypothetical protein